MYVLLADTTGTSYVKINISNQYVAYILVCETVDLRTLATNIASRSEALTLDSSDKNMGAVFVGEPTYYEASCYFVVSGSNITGAYIKSKSQYDRARLYGLIKI